MGVAVAVGPVVAVAVGVKVGVEVEGGSYDVRYGICACDWEVAASMLARINSEIAASRLMVLLPNRKLLYAGHGSTPVLPRRVKLVLSGYRAIRLFGVAIKGQLNQTVNQLRVWQSACLPQFRVHAGFGEAGYCIDLIHQHLPTVPKDE